MKNSIKTLAVVVFLLAAVSFAGPDFLRRHSAFADSTKTTPQTEVTAQCPDAKESGLPLPSSMSPDAFHDKLLAFLQNTEYVKLQWCVDKGVRDTGPFVSGTYLGVHPA